MRKYIFLLIFMSAHASSQIVYVPYMNNTNPETGRPIGQPIYNTVTDDSGEDLFTKVRQGSLQKAQTPHPNNANVEYQTTSPVFNTDVPVVNSSQKQYAIPSQNNSIDITNGVNYNNNISNLPKEVNNEQSVRDKISNSPSYNNTVSTNAQNTNTDIINQEIILQPENTKPPITYENQPNSYPEKNKDIYDQIQIDKKNAIPNLN